MKLPKLVLLANKVIVTNILSFKKYNLYARQSHRFAPVILSVNPDNLLDPREAFFKAAKRTSPANKRTPDPIKAVARTV
jgi:hypothetical protein